MKTRNCAFIPPCVPKKLATTFVLLARSSARPESRTRYGLTYLVTMLALVIGLVDNASSEQAIEASSTPFNYHCLLNNDGGPGLREVYIRLSFNPGTTAARFMLVPTPGATMTYLSESVPFSHTGNTQSGITICFGSCLNVSQVNLIATITYMSYGTDARCSELRVVPYPGEEVVEVMNCTGGAVSAYVADLQLLPQVLPFPIPCDCQGYHRFSGVPQVFDCQPLASESATWGRVKALYR